MLRLMFRCTYPHYSGNEAEQPYSFNLFNDWRTTGKTNLHQIGQADLYLMVEYSSKKQIFKSFILYFWLPMPDKSINLFISYSHDDDPYFKVFSDGLKKVVKNSQHFDWKLWDDRNIHVGTFWDSEIQDNIQNCNIAMLLVSVGFMASSYIKEREYSEFKKKYADKGVLIFPIVFKPCDFNSWEDLGKLQFFKPKGANYGKSEIEDFTYSDLIKFKETDGVLIPNPNTERYHLAVAKAVENSFKEFQSRKVQAEIDLIKTSSPVISNKLSDFPKPSSLFTGRRIEIDEFKKTFESSRIFAIEGLGGTGKTQFAAKCIEEVINDKNRIIWLNGSAQSDFDVFVETAGYGDVLKGEKKTDIAIYSGLKDLIEKDERIIFWDNFNDYEDTTFSKFLSFANQYLQKARIILITKVEPSIDGITSIPIVRLEGLDKDALDYAKKFKNSSPRYNSIADSDLVKICDGVDGHPLAIEFSMLLMGYGKPAEEILEHMPEFSGLKKVEEFSKRLFLDIFNHPNTTDEEKDCLLRCSVFKEKIGEGEIKFLYDGKDIFHLLAGLIDKLLIKLKDGFYEIHPLIRSFSYEKLSDKKNTHKKAAEYFIAKRVDSLNASLEEKIFYHLSKAEEWQIIAETIESVGTKFVQQGQFGLLYELMNLLTQKNIYRSIFDIFYGDIAEIHGNWDNAQKFYEQAMNVEDNILVKAEGMIKYAEILQRKGKVKEALPIYTKAYEFTRNIDSLKKEEAWAINNIGGVYDFFGDKSEAFIKYNEALTIRIDIKHKQGIADSLGNIGGIYDTQGNMDKALEFYEKSLKIVEEIGNKQGIAASLGNIGAVYVNKKNKHHDYDLAIDYLFKSLAISNTIGAKPFSKTTINWINDVREILGLGKFKSLAQQSLEKLDSQMQKHIPLKELLNEPVHVEKKIGRNEPCPCGSGKKYKVCHGK